MEAISTEKTFWLLFVSSVWGNFLVFETKYKSPEGSPVSLHSHTDLLQILSVLARPSTTKSSAKPQKRKKGDIPSGNEPAKLALNIRLWRILRSLVGEVKRSKTFRNHPKGLNRSLTPQSNVFSLYTLCHKKKKQRLPTPPTPLILWLGWYPQWARDAKLIALQRMGCGRGRARDYPLHCSDLTERIPGDCWTFRKHPATL